MFPLTSNTAHRCIILPPLHCFSLSTQLIIFSSSYFWTVDVASPGELQTQGVRNVILVQYPRSHSIWDPFCLSPCLSPINICSVSLFQTHLVFSGLVRMKPPGFLNCMELIPPALENWPDDYSALTASLLKQATHILPLTEDPHLTLSRFRTTTVKLAKINRLIS